MAETSTTLSIILKLVDEASAGLSGITGTIERNKASIQGLAVGAGIASAAIIGFAKSSIDAYSNSQDIATQLNAVLASTKGVAGETAEAAIKLSKALEGVTRYSDEDVLSVENLLLTFTKIKADTMPQATETVLDMATALGEDTKDAAIQLGKALQDPVLGITALRRVGVNFSDDQKKVIEQLVKTGQSAKAQQLILKELNTEFGGSAKAAAGTYAGQMAQLANQIDDVQETIGQALVPVLTQLMTALTPIIKSVGEWIEKHPELTKWIIILGGGLAVLVALLAGVALILPGLVLLFNPVTAVIVGIAAAVVALGAAIALNWGNIKKWTADMVSYVTALLDKIMAPINAVKNAVGGVIGKVGGAIGGTISAVASVIPHFATGGIVNGPTVAMIGEAGPEAVIPLSAMGGMGGGITVQVNGGYYLDDNAATDFGNRIANILVRQFKQRNYAT